jgi:hypothetical protein
LRAATLALLYLLVAAQAASAHGGGGPSGFVSTVDRIVNANGVDVSVASGGKFRMTAPSGATVVVDGYSGEPYVRFAGDRIYENERAPTTYVNRDDPPPDSADAGAAPKWNEVASGRTYTWHDHRTHWMGTEDPGSVRRDRGDRHHISEWIVTGTVDGERFAVHGALDWIPQKGGLGWKWLLAPVVAGALIYGAFLTFAGRRPVA